MSVLEPLVDLRSELAAGDQPVPAEPLLDVGEETTLRVLRERVKMRDGTTMTVERLAAITGCHASSIRNWEYGRTSPSVPVEKFSSLCSVLGVTIHQLAEAYANSARLNASPEAPDPLFPMPKAEERAAGIKGKRRRGRIR